MAHLPLLSSPPYVPRPTMQAASGVADQYLPHWQAQTARSASYAEAQRGHGIHWHDRTETNGANRCRLCGCVQNNGQVKSVGARKQVHHKNSM